VSSRVRIRFTKLGKIRWISHRDVARVWERAFRRVELPLAYTAGFSPRPKVSFGLALPTGYESVAEYLDVETTEADLDVRTLSAQLSAVLPDGIDVTAADWIDPRTPSLQEDVESCTWRWTTAGDPSAQAELDERVTRLLDSPTAVVTRSRKGQPVTEDVRAGILDLQVAGVWLEAELACKPRGLRPSDVMAALEARSGPTAEQGRSAEQSRGGPGEDAGRLEERDVRRTNQWMWRDGARLEPLTVDGPAGATGAPHALGRAS
jgi:radical SAM-linked protein